MFQNIYLTFNRSTLAPHPTLSELGNTSRYNSLGMSVPIGPISPLRTNFPLTALTRPTRGEHCLEWSRLGGDTNIYQFNPTILCLKVGDVETTDS